MVEASANPLEFCNAHKACAIVAKIEAATGNAKVADLGIPP